MATVTSDEGEGEEVAEAAEVPEASITTSVRVAQETMRMLQLKDAPSTILTTSKMTILRIWSIKLVKKVGRADVMGPSTTMLTDSVL